MIDIRDLQVFFGPVHAVRGATFSVASGESFGLVGESGSGQSTVLRAICGLTPDWTGEIALNGMERRLMGKSFYKMVQMVFQDPYGSLHPRHTVDRILAEPIAIHKLNNSEHRIEKALDAVGLGPSFRFRYPHQLSGGQRQRVAIARALILEPRILLLDEPTSALDVSVQAEVLNLLKTLRQELGLTYILVSHDLGVVSHMCDRLAVMQHGRIVEEMTAQALAAGTPSHPYTRQLLVASRGYDRAKIDQFVDFAQ